ncbi:MAG: ABC transporter permease, partial [Gammaproteobacteria bacterium]|nr:ABC transporter permease [Gammaproteobacteria bacterium]
MIKPVLLTTDILLFLLLAVVVVFILYARARPHIRGPWRRVFSGRIASASAVILLAFILIGLLDSLHFRLPLENNGTTEEVFYSGDVLSALDVMMGPLRTRVEKTYSAPFATHLFSRETMYQPDGSEIRSYPLLEYGGRHLQDTGRSRGQDILVRSLLALLGGLLASVLVFVLLAALLARRDGCAMRRKMDDILSQNTALPWRVILVTISVLLLLVFVSINLAGAYHILGTDKVGQDVFYQALKSIRTGLIIGSLTTLIMLPFAIMMG